MESNIFQCFFSRSAACADCFFAHRFRDFKNLNLPCYRLVFALKSARGAVYRHHSKHASPRHHFFAAPCTIRALFFRSPLPAVGPRIRARFQLVFSCSKQRGAKSTDALLPAQALPRLFFDGQRLREPSVWNERVIRVPSRARSRRSSVVAAFA